MELTIKSKKLNRKLIFSRPGYCYLFVNLNGEPGTLGNQMCYRGSTLGNTIVYFGDDKDRFDKICRKWYRNYIKQMEIKK